jgi:hypothetical protein
MVERYKLNGCLGRKVAIISNPNLPVKSIIDMARAISASGHVGQKRSKDEAAGLVRDILGTSDQDFTLWFGYNYWNYLKAMLNEYIASRNLENGFVVKGSPFHWHNSIGTKASAVILRKDFFRGDEHVEPELFLEVGLLTGANGTLIPGVSYGFHYLPSIEGDRSRFIQGVLENPELRSITWAMSNNGFVNPALRTNGADAVDQNENPCARASQRTRLMAQ